MLYENVKRLCEKKDITIGELERKMSFSNSSIRKWNETEPGIHKVQKVAKYLGVTIEQLLEPEDGSDQEKEVG